ncbi:phage protein [Lacticaseibacillus paracasei subsp. paracasei Lpp14]|uniref:Phage protein n=1 Tax=Lacticaseibacillus paracasei subsp. paracasei Lpp14 TaxID=1256204 RepID=A0A829GR47_LACPA|nr:phage protein [Lacticaseibacillus paracasei subsp. paracasei Lpp14]
MSELKLYAVKNDEGEWLSFDSSHESVWDTNNPTLFKHKSYADAQSRGRRARVVELIEATAKVVVSEEEAEMLETLDGDLMPISELAYFVHHAKQLSEKESIKREDRLMRAYVNGWEVEKPKRYVLPMPGTDYHNNQMHGNAQYYAVKGTGNWRPDAIALGTDDAVKHGYTVTQSDIDAAPDWVKAITPVEVTDDGND